MNFNTKVGGAELIDEAVELIKNGEIVAFPTETVYGLGASALDEKAVGKIFEAKNRPKDNPFIIHVSNVDFAESVAYVTEEARRLFSLFSPGPLTIVLKKKPCVPYVATAGLDTVGIRIPAHPMCREFLSRCGLPVAAPSANASKRVSPTKAEYVYDDMRGRIPLILDGGECEVGIESTVLSLAEDVPTVLRPGMVTIEQLAKVLPAVKSHTGIVKVAPSPGMKYRHYAPIVPCYLFDNPNAALKYYDKWSSEGLKPIILTKNSKADFYRKREVAPMGENGREIAHSVFGLLRYCEKKYDRILVEKLSDYGEEGAVMNRLLKSCEGNILF